MGDAGEGLVDSEARIQERQDDIERERAERGRTVAVDPEAHRVAESLRLARAELERQLAATTHVVNTSAPKGANAEYERAPRIDGPPGGGRYSPHLCRDARELIQETGVRSPSGTPPDHSCPRC